uniref:Uncharacterized protein n=1 Tax=Rhabditophanes sp. KR3021 TaxID=114890 RepID=A0AC35U734_9BILA
MMVQSEAVQYKREPNSNLRRHLLSSSRFWIGKRSGPSPKMRPSQLAKSIRFWGKRFDRPDFDSLYEDTDNNAYPVYVQSPM